MRSWRISATWRIRRRFASGCRRQERGSYRGLRGEVDVQCGDGSVGGEVVEGGDAAVAPVGAGVSPGVEAGEDDCGSGGV